MGLFEDLMAQASEMVPVSSKPGSYVGLSQAILLQVERTMETQGLKQLQLSCGGDEVFRSYRGKVQVTVGEISAVFNKTDEGSFWLTKQPKDSLPAFQQLVNLLGAQMEESGAKRARVSAEFKLLPTDAAEA